MRRTPTADPDQRPARPRRASDRIREFFAELGPGLITGAADDDPSGVSTYSVTGAAFGYARIFKWLTLVLFAYVGAGLLAAPAWSAVLRATFIPHIEWSASFFSVLVGLLGTTISPYLFFWQASQEVEEERAQGRKNVRQRK